METFIKKLCSRYKVSEADVQSLLDCMEEVHFKKRELIVREGTKNSNLYFIRNGIWRAYYHKDGEETTIWFASDGEAAFSVWGYVDNAYSLVNIQAMCDSVAYCISRAALNQLFSSSIGQRGLLYLPRCPESVVFLIYRACQPGTPTHGSSIPTTRELAHKPRKSTGQGTLPESHQRDTGIIAICTSKTYSILSVDHTAVAQQDSGGDSS